MQQSAPNGPRYAVKHTETIMADSAIRARLFTLAPTEIIPWHRHSAVTDHYFVLRGHLTVDTRLPDVRTDLSTGDRFQITPGVDHQLANSGSSDCEFLLLQGVGVYDWIGRPDVE
jgi:quercetin dioxygenase-like cupin family protein